MKQLQILYIGRNAEIKDTVVRLLNGHEGWKAEGVMEDADVFKAWERQAFDIVMLGNGISETCEAALCNFCREQKEDVMIIQHYGGGSGLLYNEILEALHHKQHRV